MSKAEFSKPSTIRLTPEQAHLIEFAAGLEDTPPTQSDIIREAIGEYLGKLAGNNETFANEVRTTLQRRQDSIQADLEVEIGFPIPPPAE